MINRPGASAKSLFIATRSKLLRTVRELNLFSNNPFWSSTLNCSEQILSTRLFILFLSVSLVIVIIYTSLIVQTHTVTRENFSLNDFEQLQARYPTTINAPCTQVSNPYDKFIQLSVKFHEVCSSPFIDDKWTSSLFLPNATSHNILDFRTFAFAQFRALALLCHTANQSIYDGYRTFNSTQLVTSHVLSRARFNEIVRVLTKNLRKNIVANENQTVRILSMSTARNRIMSALRTNFYIQPEPNSNNFVQHNALYLMDNRTSSSECDCRLEGNQCIYPAGAFYNWTSIEVDKPAKSNPPPLFQIPGLMAGCLPLDSIRQSTLECLYNQSCINILSIQPHIALPRPLQTFSPNFPPNSIIGSMFDNSLFVESWHKTSSFEDYFNVCAPRSLTYSDQRRYRLGSIFTICLSAFGGLVIIWPLIIPAVVKLWTAVKWKKQQRKAHISSNQINAEQTSREATSELIKKVVISHAHRTIYTFNLFPSEKEDDFEEKYDGIIATRLYILLLLFGVIILGFSTSLEKRIQTYNVSSPSLMEFEELETHYPSTLICPCSNLSMSHGRIMSVFPRYHEICSSKFITKTWLSYFERIETKPGSTLFSKEDFRNSGQSFFTTIGGLCQSTKESVENAIRSFKSRRLVTVNCLSHKQFNGETQARLKQLTRQTIKSFMNLLELMRSSIHTNHLVSDLLTNAGFSSKIDNQTSERSLAFYFRGIYNDSCSCSFSSECTRPLGFYLQNETAFFDPTVTIPGLVLGCYTIDSLLLSTLECLYERTCIKLIVDMHDFGAIGLFQPLDNQTTHIETLHQTNSRFSFNTTVKSIVSQLLIEDWGFSQNFTAYYERCAPKQCAYSIRRRFDKAYMVAMMFGFCSGLNAILEIILPSFVRFIRRRWKKQQNNINSPETTDNPIDSSIRTKKSSLFVKIYQSFRSLNLFDNKSSTDRQTGHQERIATRIYLILFVLSLVAAFLYAGPFNEDTKSVLIELPTSDVVNDLHAKKRSDLSCPCSTAAIRYSIFLSVIPEYHSICSSDYIKPTYWIDLFKKRERVSVQVGIHYRVLASLCQQADRFIKSAQNLFDAHELISVETMTQSSFLRQTEALVSTFITEIPADYRRTVKLIIRSFGVNQLLNVLSSNWKLAFTDENEDHILKTHPRPYPSSNCTCATSFDCTEEVEENIVRGCFPFDGFRLSKFENVSLSEFNDKLFVETWKNESNYTNYFEACHPLECRYTLPLRNDPITMLTTVLGLYGGLTCVLRFIVGQSLHAYHWWSTKRFQQQTEITSIDLVTM